VLAKLKVRVVEVAQIFAAAGQERVEAQNVRAVRQQPIDKVSADKTGAAREDDPHRPIPA